MSKSKITSNIDYLDCWKVFTPRANNVGTELNDDNLNTFIGKPGQICTEAYIMFGYGLVLNENSAKNLAKYFNTNLSDLCIVLQSQAMMPLVQHIDLYLL